MTATSATTAPATDARAARLRRPLNLRAGLLALALSTAWGGNPVAIKAGLEDAPPLRLGWMRFLLGGLVVLAYIVITRQSMRIARREWKPLLLLGALFSIQLAFMNLGQARTTAGHAVVITSTFPLWTGVFAHIFVPGDRMSRTRTLGTLVAYGGVVIVFWQSIAGGAGVSVLGDVMLLSSAVLLGARQVYLSQTAQGIAVHKLLVAQMALGIASFLLASLFLESDAYRMTSRLTLALLYQGVFIAGFGFLGQTWLLKNYLPSRVTVISLSQPVFGVLFSWWILGEPIGPELYAGAALVVVGSFLAQRRR